MSGDLLNIGRREAARAMAGRAATRLAVVSGYDPGRYAAKVRLQPEDAETGWLPIATPWSGDGWGLFGPPAPGDVVEVHFQEGGKEAGFVALRHYGDRLRPLPVPSGEFWLVHASGSRIVLGNDGKLSLNGEVEIDATSPTVNVTATTRVNVTAPEIRLGSQGQELHRLVTDALVELYNIHVHPDAHGGTTGVPIQQMGNSHLTAVTHAG